MKRILCFVLMLSLISFYTQAQTVNDIIKWEYKAKKTGDNTYDVSVKATIKKGWHLYTPHPGGDGTQIPTEVFFLPNPNVKLNGKVKAIGKVTSETVDPVGTIHYFMNTVTYKQKITVSQNTLLKGYIHFQTCNESMCLPPADDSFSIPIKGLVGSANKDDVGSTQTPETQPKNTSAAVIKTDTAKAIAALTPTLGGANGGSSGGNNGGTTSPEVKNQTSVQPKADASMAAGSVKSLWAIFLTGLGAGLLAFITPCIYAMLPITVSFFTKRSKDRTTGIKNAVIYSLAIIGIFLVVGVLISLFFSETTMYSISTSAAFNLFVFAVFALFGISLLGAFEITLPSSWSNKLDQKANATTFWGIFFMALVLVVVSFSCTSAFISFLIVQIVQAHNRLGGLIGFLGFGISIAAPFAFFAFFPGWLNNIAKSGGWLNTVKVTLGFIELAMAMKFLSNVDLQYHWHLLDYNVYLAIWVILFGLLGFYLLGKLKFAHDGELPKNNFGQSYLSITRLFCAMASLAFAVYMIPGMFGAPLLGISGWLPEKKTLNANFYDKLTELQEANQSASGAHPVLVNQKYAPKKYTDFLTSELPGVTTYFDYDEALAAGRALHKPVLLDFTGHSCVNCRKMEAAVLSRPKVLSKIKSDFILASLFCDERHDLLPQDQYVSKTGKKIKTIGEKNIDIEANRYGEVGQPIYIFVDGHGNVIKNAKGYNPDIDRFLKIMAYVNSEYSKGESSKNIALSE